jgi:hypothetical protein
MALTSISSLYPGGWDQLAAEVQAMRAKLFGVVPAIPAVDVSDLKVPEEVLQSIRDKNRKRVREEIPLAEFVAEDSPFRTGAFFDDQLLEIIFSIQHKYKAEEFVEQMVRMIEIFLNESAAFRCGVVQNRIGPTNASACVSGIEAALKRSADPDETKLLELLLTDLTYGGEEPWVAFLQPAQKTLVEQVVARQK